ncbi:Ionotropic receptor 75b, partial [Diabrotica virgifera virgifera]
SFNLLKLITKQKAFFRVVDVDPTKLQHNKYPQKQLFVLDLECEHFEKLLEA